MLTDLTQQIFWECGIEHNDHVDTVDSGVYSAGLVIPNGWNSDKGQSHRVHLICMYEMGLVDPKNPLCSVLL